MRPIRQCLCHSTLDSATPCRRLEYFANQSNLSDQEFAGMKHDLLRREYTNPTSRAATQSHIPAGAAVAQLLNSRVRLLLRINWRQHKASASLMPVVIQSGNVYSLQSATSPRTQGQRLECQDSFRLHHGHRGSDRSMDSLWRSAFDRTKLQ